MRTCRPPRKHRRVALRRPGLTLVELMAACLVMTLIAGAIGSLSLAVQGANKHCTGQASAAQHGRVVLLRIEQAVDAAQASEQFPACVVFADVVAGYSFPDTLVVWRPETTAVDPAGRPRVNELVVYCPDPASPNRLLELRQTADSSVTPALASTAAWTTLLTTLKTTANSRTELTDLLRTAQPVVSANGAPSSFRGAVRFNLLMSPNAAQWSQYRAGTRMWGNLDWPLDIYGSKTGQRTIVCQTELQLLTGEGTSADAAAPFFGSASTTCELQK